MSDNSDNSGDDKSGYGKPPKHTRFVKGQSGNPKGRPKKSKNIKSIYESVLFEPTQISLAGNTSTVPMLEAIIRRMSIKAANGDQQAANKLLKEAITYFPETVHNVVPVARMTLMHKCSECSKESPHSKNPNKKPKEE
jgi:hypothetical protein